MRKSLPYEILAAISAIVGAGLLVAIYFPILNPGQYRIEAHHEVPSVGYYIIATPFPLLILGAAWYWNRKAQRMKRDENDDHKPSA
jgi:hypothetical protein